MVEFDAWAEVGLLTGRIFAERASDLADERIPYDASRFIDTESRRVRVRVETIEEGPV